MQVEKFKTPITNTQEDFQASTIRRKSNAIASTSMVDEPLSKVQKAIKVMDLEGFKETQSELGSYFMAELLFGVMVRLREALNTNMSNEMMLG
jgi:hypothetical protein